MHAEHAKPVEAARIKDMGVGFGRFVDEVLRGRSNKTILNSSVGLAALDVGWPKETPLVVNGETLGMNEAQPFNLSRMIINNKELEIGNPEGWSSGVFDNDQHPLFDFSAENFTLFGLDFLDMWHRTMAGMGQYSPETIAELEAGEAMGAHYNPIYPSTVAEEIGLPDLPYGEFAHLAHLGMALYDSGRTFQDLWEELRKKYKQDNTDPLEQAAKYAARTGKIITHPDMLHTLAARGVMLTVMGLLHPLGAVVSIGVSYLCMHLVHSFFSLIEGQKDAVRRIESVPLLRDIYNASGIKEWAERDKDALTPDEEAMDPFGENAFEPQPEVGEVKEQGKLSRGMAEARAAG